MNNAELLRAMIEAVESGKYAIADILHEVRPSCANNDKMELLEMRTLLQHLIEVHVGIRPPL